MPFQVVGKSHKMRAFLLVLGCTVPLTAFAVFAPGVVDELTVGILIWDVLALLLAPTVIFALCVWTIPRVRTFAVSLVLALILCAVWSVAYYPVSRVFIPATVVGKDGLESLPPLSEADITRIVRGNCFLVCGCICGALLTIMEAKKK